MVGEICILDTIGRLALSICSLPKGARDREEEEDDDSVPCFSERQKPAPGEKVNGID